MDAVVGQPSTKQSRGWLTPLRIVIAAAVVLVVVGGLFFWKWMSDRNAKTEKVDAAIAQSEEAYGKGEYVNALNLARGQIQKATSDKQKAHVYQAAAQAASGANNLVQAAEYYELAHKANPATAKPDAYTLAVIYDRLEKRDQALAQYKVALEYAKANKNQYNSDVPAIEEAIKVLEEEK